MDAVDRLHHVTNLLSAADEYLEMEATALYDDTAEHPGPEEVALLSNEVETLGEGLDDIILAVASQVKQEEEDSRHAFMLTRLADGARVDASLKQLGSLLSDIDDSIGRVHSACSAAGSDVSLINLIDMLDEACTICLTKTAGLQVCITPETGAKFISATHAEWAVKAAAKSKRELLSIFKHLGKLQDQNSASILGRCLMAAADEFLEAAVWQALKSLWHSLPLHLLRGPCATHFGIRCNMCQAIPIKGPRYHSVSALGGGKMGQLDLCHECYLLRQLPVDTMMVQVNVPIPIGHYESKCGFCLKVPIIGGRFRSRNHVIAKTGLPYELCNKCFTYNPEHFHDPHDQFDEIGSEENKLRAFQMKEHTRRDSEDAGEWFNCTNCHRRRKYSIHGPVFWLLGVHAKPPVILCAECETRKAFDVALERLGEHPSATGMPSGFKALWLVTSAPITESYFFNNTKSFPVLYQREDEPAIPEMMYKATNKKILARIILLADSEDQITACRRILAQGTLNNKSMAELSFELGERLFVRIFTEVYKQLHLELETQIRSFYDLNAEQEAAMAEIQEERDALAEEAAGAAFGQK